MDGGGGVSGSPRLSADEELRRVLGWRLGLAGGQRPPCWDWVSE